MILLNSEELGKVILVVDLGCMQQRCKNQVIMHKFYWNGRQRVPVAPGGPSPIGASGVVVSRGSTAQPSRITSDIYHEVFQVCTA